jgi:DNA-directed RNA polymerase specialized sigma subunit
VDDHEDRDLVARAVGGDAGAADALRSRYRPLAVSIVERWGQGPTADDALDALMNGLADFDISAGHKFSTHATWVMRHVVTDKP